MFGLVNPAWTLSILLLQTLSWFDLSMSWLWKELYTGWGCRSPGRGDQPCPCPVSIAQPDCPLQGTASLCCCLPQSRLGCVVSHCPGQWWWCSTELTQWLPLRKLPSGLWITDPWAFDPEHPCGFQPTLWFTLPALIFTLDAAILHVKSLANVKIYFTIALFYYMIYTFLTF